MNITNTETRYGIITILLHWLMAVIIIGMLALGLYMVRLPISGEKLKFYGWHKEFGVLVLALVIVRLAWRLINKIPLLPVIMPKWEKIAARLAHYAFYFFMIALPITGWMMSSASGLPVSFFGLFVLPNLISPDDQNRILLAEIHEWLAYGLIAVLCVHIAAAFKHHFINKDDVLRRMLG